MSTFNAQILEKIMELAEIRNHAGFPLLANDSEDIVEDPSGLDEDAETEEDDDIEDDTEEDADDLEDDEDEDDEDDEDEDDDADTDEEVGEEPVAA